MPLTSGVSEIAACHLSPITDDPSAVPSLTSPPSFSSLDASPCMPAVVLTTVLFKVLYCEIKNIFFTFCVCFVNVLFVKSINLLGLPRLRSGKESACQCRRRKRQFRSLGGEDSLEEEMTTHSSILAWKILWTEDPGGLWSRVLAKGWT